MINPAFGPPIDVQDVGASAEQDNANRSEDTQNIMTTNNYHTTPSAESVRQEDARTDPAPRVVHLLQVTDLDSDEDATALLDDARTRVSTAPAHLSPNDDALGRESATDIDSTGCGPSLATHKQGAAPTGSLDAPRPNSTSDVGKRHPSKGARRFGSGGLFLSSVCMKSVLMKISQLQQLSA